MDLKKTFKKEPENKEVESINCRDSNPNGFTVRNMKTRQVVQCNRYHAYCHKTGNPVYKHGPDVLFEPVSSVLVYQVDFVSIATYTTRQKQIIEHPQPVDFHIEGLGNIGTRIFERKILPESLENKRYK